MAFDHLKLSATECFQSAADRRISKPETSMAFESDGHDSLAAFLLANGEPGWEIEVKASIEIDLARFREYGTTVRSFAQPKHLLLALAIGDQPLAKSIAEIPLDRKHWSALDAHITYEICKVLNVSQPINPPRDKLIDSEFALINAVRAIYQSEEPDMHAVDKAWRNMRKKRYQFTIFEHGNLLGLAISNLRSAGGVKSVA